MRVAALVLRAGAVVVLAGVGFSLAASTARRSPRPPSGRSRPGEQPVASGRREAEAAEATAWARHRGGRRRHRDGLDPEPAAGRRPLVLLARDARPRRRRRARQPGGDALHRRHLEVRALQHRLLRLPDAALVRPVAEGRRLHRPQPRQQPRLRLRRAWTAADAQGAGRRGDPPYGTAGRDRDAEGR